MFRSSVPTAPSVPVQGRSFVCRRIRIQKPSLKHLVSSLQQQQQQQQQHQPNINSTHLLGFLMGRFLSPQSSSSNSQSLILRDCDLLVDRFDLGRRSAAPNNNVTGAGPLMRVPTVAMDGDVLLHIFVKHNTHPSTADMCLEDEEGFVKMKQVS